MCSKTVSFIRSLIFYTYKDKWRRLEGNGNEMYCIPEAAAVSAVRPHEVGEGADLLGFGAVHDGEALVAVVARDVAEVAVEGLVGAVVVAALGFHGQREQRPHGALEERGAELRGQGRVVRVEAAEGGERVQHLGAHLRPSPGAGRRQIDAGEVDTGELHRAGAHDLRVLDGDIARVLASSCLARGWWLTGRRPCSE
jgi:hypothetical protein